MKPDDVLFLIEVEITHPVNAYVGTVGPQGLAEGGGSQLHFILNKENRSSVFQYIKGTGKKLE